MATHFTIPTWFTAVDKISSPVAGMSASVEQFAMKAETGINRAERAFRKVTPALGEAQKQMLSMVGTAAVVGAAFAGAAFSGKSIMDYENELQNLLSVTGASEEQFKLFKAGIKSVADETKTSSVTVAQAFTAIANNQPELLKDAAALAAVTKSSILLAKASKMELQPAGEALTQVLNQFGKGAADAEQTINDLAAGSVIGSSEIRDTADAIQKFGTVAANAGIKINESVALIELSSKFEKGAEAGSKLRNILITMSTAKVQDPKAIADMQRLGVNMDLVADKSKPLSQRLVEMAKVAKDDAALFHIFGKENQALATGVLNNAGSFETLLTTMADGGVTAKKMADINDKTLSKSIERLTNKWVTMITTSDGASAGLSAFTSAAEFLTKNLDTVVTIALSVLGVFVAWWAIMKVARIALFAYNVGLGIYNAYMGISTVYTAAQTTAQTAQTAAQWALNAAMAANPIGLVIIAVAALTAGIYYLINAHEEMEAAFQAGVEKAKVEQINKQRQAVDELTASYQKQNMTYDEANKKAVQHEQAINDVRVAKLNAMAIENDKKLANVNPVMDFLNGSGESKALEQKGVEIRGALGIALANKTDLQKQLIDPKANQANQLSSTINNNTNKNITFDFKNMPKGVEVSGDGMGGDVTPSTSSTMK